MKFYYTFFFIFVFLCCSSQEIIDKESFKKCKKEFSKKICLSDEDGDGVLFYLDHCPKEAGVAENNGCPKPDTDGDGIWDMEDACPTIAGMAETNGCPWPDADGDGIFDMEDACPTVPGYPEYKGCSKIDCSENYKIARKEADDYIILQKEINYKSIQKPILEILKKIKFDSAVLLIINPNIYEGHGPSECPTLEFPETLNYTSESYIWDEEMLKNISTIINQNIFPASSNSLFWRLGGFYRENDEEFRKLNNKQIAFINKLSTFSDSKYGKIKYFKKKNLKITNVSEVFNRIIFYQNKTLVNNSLQTTIELIITTKKQVNNYLFTYDFTNKIWFLNSNRVENILNNKN